MKILDTLFTASLDSAGVTTESVAAGAGWPVTEVRLVPLGELANPRGQQLVGTILIIDARWRHPSWRSLVNVLCKHKRHVDAYGGGCEECLTELADEQCPADIADIA